MFLYILLIPRDKDQMDKIRQFLRRIYKYIELKHERSFIKHIDRIIILIVEKGLNENVSIKELFFFCVYQFPCKRTNCIIDSIKF